MPLARFKVRNEFGLGRPELYGNATVEDEDPKAVLGGVTVAGLVGLLRQLGDLAEFAAEVFYGIQEQVTITASRSQNLTRRVRRIESTLSPLEKAVLSQTSHIHLAYTAGCEWHPRLQNGKNHFIHSDLPLFVMESYEQCKDPPPLHLLDKFDVAGPGSCLRKYSDPTFFRKKLVNPNESNEIKVQRDKNHRKSKKKRSSQRNIPRSRLVSTSGETSGTQPSSLTNDRQTTSLSTSTVGMACVSDMQEQPDALKQSEYKIHDTRDDSSYIDYLINQCPMDDEPEEKLSDGSLHRSPQHDDSIDHVVDDNIPSGETIEEVLESKFGPGTPENITRNQQGCSMMDPFDRIQQSESEGEDQSEADDFVDARNTIESESDNDLDDQQKQEPEHYSLHMEDNAKHHHSNDESCPVHEEIVSCDKTFQEPRDLVSTPGEALLDESSATYSLFSEVLRDELIEESITTDHSLAEAVPDQLSDEIIATAPSLNDPVASCSLSAEAFPEEKSSPEEHIEKILPDESDELLEASVAMQPLSAEAFSNERISPEESISTYPLLPDALSEELLEDSVDMHPLLEEAFSNEGICLEESIATYPLLPDALSDELLEESMATSPSLEQPVATYERISPEASLSDELIEESDATVPSPGPKEQISVEEPVTTDSLSEDPFPDERISPEVIIPMHPLLTETYSDELLEETAATAPSMTEACPQENISLVEPVPYSEISSREAIDICPLLTKAFPDESSKEDPSEEAFADESVSMEPSVPKPILHETDSLEESILADTFTTEACVFSKDPVAMDASLADSISEEDIHDKRISHEEPLAMAQPNDATWCSDGDTAKDIPQTASSLLADSTESCVESVTIWSNGSLLGLEPSKPPVFATPSCVNEDTQQSINMKIEPLHNSRDVSHSDTSFGVFGGLSHRLLMTGFCRNSSALPACSNTEMAMEDESFGSESLIDSPPASSSPRLEHMTISFTPIDGFGYSKLKLKIPSHEKETDMFPMFQLVPESEPSHNTDEDTDTFCGTSSYCVSDSELWGSYGSPEMNEGDDELALRFDRQNGDTSSISTSPVAGIDVEDSLSGYSLDLPCFDAMGPSLSIRGSQIDSHQELPSHGGKANALRKEEPSFKKLEARKMQPEGQ